MRRNLLANPHATMHLDDARSAVVGEGRCAFSAVPRGTADRLVEATTAKHGYAPPPSAYLAGVWVLVPERVLAWTDLTADATRLVFGEHEPG